MTKLEVKKRLSLLCSGCPYVRSTLSTLFLFDIKLEYFYAFSSNLDCALVWANFEYFLRLCQHTRGHKKVLSLHTERARYWIFTALFIPQTISYIEIPLKGNDYRVKVIAPRFVLYFLPI